MSECIEKRSPNYEVTLIAHVLRIINTLSLRYIVPTFLPLTMIIVHNAGYNDLRDDDRISRTSSGSNDPRLDMLYADASVFSSARINRYRSRCTNGWRLDGGCTTALIVYALLRRLSCVCSFLLPSWHPRVWPPLAVNN